jgi:hypothetical protein
VIVALPLHHGNIIMPERRFLLFRRPLVSLFFVFLLFSLLSVPFGCGLETLDNSSFDSRSSFLQQTSLEGTLLVDVADDFDHHRSWMVYHLREKWSGRLVRLQGTLGVTKLQTPYGSQTLQAHQRGLETGDLVRLTGAFVQEKTTSAKTPPLFQMQSLKVERTALSLQKPLQRLKLPGTHWLFGQNTPAPLLNTAATIKRAVAVVIVNLQDKKAFNSNRTYLEELVYKKNNDVYDKATFGMLQFTQDADGNNKPDIYGPFTLKDNSTVNCFANYRRWQNEAIALGEKAGVDFSGHNHIIFMIPNLKSCKFAGIAAVGNIRAKGPYPVSIRTEGSSPRVTSHELGHNIGLRHASIDPNNDGKHNTKSVKEEYGDYSCLMSVKLANFNAPHMLELRVFDRTPKSVLHLKAGKSTVKLYPLLADPTKVAGPQVLVFPNFKLFRNYVLSFKTGRYYDRVINSAYKAGVSIHTQRFTRVGQTLFVKALKSGATFKDSNGIEIKQLRKDPKNAFVELSINIPGPGAGCKKAPPVLTAITPTIKAGIGLFSNLRFQVENKNSGDCGTSLFALSPKLPGKYTLSSNLYAKQQVTLAPGGKIIVTVGVVNDGTSGKVTVELSDIFPGGQAPVSQSAQVNVDPNVPTSPILRGYSVNGTQAQLFWTPSIDKTGLIRYQVYRQLNGAGSFRSLSGTSVNVRKLLDGRIPAGTTAVSYYVTAINRSNNRSKPSNIVALRLKSTDPASEPLELKAALDRGDGVLTWKAPKDASSGVKEYVVYHRVDGGKFQRLSTTDSLQYRHSKLPFVSNSYYVTALTGNGKESKPSNTATLNNPDKSSPSAPGELKATLINNDNDVELTWQAAQDRESGIKEYVLYRKLGDADAFEKLATVTTLNALLHLDKDGSLWRYPLLRDRFRPCWKPLESQQYRIGRAKRHNPTHRPFGIEGHPGEWKERKARLERVHR